MTEQQWMWNFGEFLRKILNDRQISMNVLANAVGVGRSTISRYVNGEIMPSLKTFNNICVALGVNPKDVLTDDFIK